MLKLRFIQKLKEIWSIDDLRVRIINTTYVSLYL